MQKKALSAVLVQRPPVLVRFLVYFMHTIDRESVETSFGYKLCLHLVS